MSKSKDTSTPNDTPKNQKTSKTKNAPGSPRIEKQGGGGIQTPLEAGSTQDTGEILKKIVDVLTALEKKTPTPRRAGTFTAREARFLGKTVPGSTEQKQNIETPNLKPMFAGGKDWRWERKKKWLQVLQREFLTAQYCPDIDQEIETLTASDTPPAESRIEELVNRIWASRRQRISETSGDKAEIPSTSELPAGNGQGGESPAEEIKRNDKYMTLEQFIKFYCDLSEKPYVKSKVTLLHQRNREKKIKLPKLACKYRRGQGKYYFPDDLIKQWADYRKEMPTLPPLKTKKSGEKVRMTGE